MNPKSRPSAWARFFARVVLPDPAGPTSFPMLRDGDVVVRLILLKNLVVHF
jgi:hypothetical protein